MEALFLEHLPVSDGWVVSFRGYDERLEDLLQLEHTRLARLIDVGWYPESDPSGRYVLHVFQGDFHGVLLHTVETGNVDVVARELVGAMQRYGSAPADAG